MTLKLIITGVYFCIILPIVLIQIFEKCDKECDTQLSKNDIKILISISIIADLVVTLGANSIYTRDEIDKTRAFTMIALTMLVTGYLIFMSYTDIKTQLLYSIVSYIMIILLISVGILNNIRIIDKTSFISYGIIAILFLMSKFRYIGLGDVLIYSALALYYNIIGHEYGFILLIVNYFLTNLLFVITVGFKKIIKKDKNRHYPLAPCIGISTLLVYIISIYLI